MEEDTEKFNPILHVLVIGFHHKKGCQVCLPIRRYLIGYVYDHNTVGRIDAKI